MAAATHSQADSLRQSLETLGLERYLEPLVRHGFDSWEALCTATESDFEAVGLKLGHRRKLQRAFSSDTESTLSNSRSELDTVRPRIYRRHPKPDKNAPVRPLTAYVRFSNDQRDVYKDNGWTFTELTRQIGHDWRTLDAEPRQKYTDEAEAAKNAHRKALWKYRQTSAYHEYARYLEEFNRQNPRPSQGHQSRRASMKSSQDQLSTSTSDFAHHSADDTQMPDLSTMPFDICTTFDYPLIDGYYANTPGSFGSLETSPISATTNMTMELPNTHVQQPLPYHPWLNSMPMENVRLDNTWGNYVDLEAGG